MKSDEAVSSKCSISAPSTLLDSQHINMKKILMLRKQILPIIAKYSRKGSLSDYIKSFETIAKFQRLTYREYNFLLLHFLNSEMKELLGSVTPEDFGSDEFIRWLCISLQNKLPTETNTIHTFHDQKPPEGEINIIKCYNELCKIL